MRVNGGTAARFAFAALLAASAACSEADLQRLRQEGESIAATAGAEAKRAAGTQSAILIETAEAIAAEQGPKFKQTAEAAVATAIAGVVRPDHRGDVVVGAYYYPWWQPGNDHSRSGYSRQPLLGDYDSADPSVVGQHIEWAADKGVDYFAMSWWGPGSFEDRVLRDVWPRARANDRLRIAIVYETIGRLAGGQLPADGIDLNDARVRATLLEDIDYLQRTYWSRGDAMTVDGRPLLAFYLSRQLRGDVSGTMQEIRDRTRSAGAEAWIIGDEVFWQRYHPISPDRLAAFDAVTAYNMHASADEVEGDFTGRVAAEYEAWRIAANRAGTVFIPGVIPGYDDRIVRSGNLPIPRSPELFASQLAMALPLVDPSAQMLLITSWNEWHEDTGIEPAEPLGITYLDVLRESVRVR